jgi:rhodanese-related sulfurtransferase
VVTAIAPGRSIDDLLADARSRIRRLSPEDAHVAHRLGAILVDIRPEAQRLTAGQIPGSLVIERNVLEWRFDPRSSARLELAHYDLEIIVVCHEGYTSSLAAAALQDLGLYRATDLDGGFVAWKAAGLPTF